MVSIVVLSVLNCGLLFIDLMVSNVMSLHVVDLVRHRVPLLCFIVAFLSGAY